MVLPAPPLFASAAAFALVFSSSAQLALRSTLPRGAAATADDDDDDDVLISLPASGAAAAAGHIVAPQEAAVWTVLLSVFVVVPLAALYYFTYVYVCPPVVARPPASARVWRPCQLVQQAHVFAAYAFFAALVGAAGFAVAWAALVGVDVALGAYGAAAPLALVLFVASYTPFPALIRRLPIEPYYLVEARPLASQRRRR